MAKDSYRFGGHADYARRFGDAVYVGDTIQGTSVWAWRDGLWVVHSVCGAGVEYIANRISVADMVRTKDTKPALEALRRVVLNMEARA